MQQVTLVHWKAEEIKERADKLASAGYEVNADLSSPATMLRQLADNPPAAVVIDLSRMPSQGRDLAILIRQRKTTRHLPLVFVDGDPQKVAAIRELLPDAVYTAWEGISSAIQQAIAKPPADPVVHDSVFAAYGGTPLLKKLGIKAGMTVALVNAPPDFEETLGTLLEDTHLLWKRGEDCNLTLWFNRSTAELQSDVTGIVRQAGYGPIWLTWPKKKSGVDSDLTQQQVRETGLSNGLVDYKICSIDEVWSGLLFRRREQ